MPPTFAAAWLALGAGPAAGLLAGGALGVANLWVLSRLVVQATAAEDVRWTVLAVRLLSKVALLAALLWVLVGPLSVDVIGLLLGLSLALVATVLGQALGLLA